MPKKKEKSVNENFAELMRQVKKQKDAAPLEGVTNNPLEGVTNNPLEGVTNNPLEGVTNDLLAGVTNDPLKGVTHYTPEGLKMSREVKTPIKKKNYMIKADIIQQIKNKAQLLDVSESALVNILLEYALGELKIE